MSKEKRTISIDFDGTLTEYARGWEGPRTVNDFPVGWLYFDRRNAIHWLMDAALLFDVCIFSSRSHQFGGRRAMKKWVEEHVASYLTRLDDSGRGNISSSFEMTWCPGSAMEPLWVVRKDVGRKVVKSIRFPKHKPASAVILDDRAIHFNGNFPSLEDVMNFKPWNR